MADLSGEIRPQTFTQYKARVRVSTLLWRYFGSNLALVVEHQHQWRCGQLAFFPLFVNKSAKSRSPSASTPISAEFRTATPATRPAAPQRCRPRVKWVTLWPFSRATDDFVIAVGSVGRSFSALTQSLLFIGIRVETGLCRCVCAADRLWERDGSDMEDIFQWTREGNAMQVRVWLDDTEHDMNQGFVFIFIVCWKFGFLGHTGVPPGGPLNPNAVQVWINLGS